MAGGYRSQSGSNHVVTERIWVDVVLFSGADLGITCTRQWIPAFARMTLKGSPALRDQGPCVRHTSSCSLTPLSSFPRTRESISTFSWHRAQRRNAFPGLHPTMDPRLREDDVCWEWRCPSEVSAGLNTHWQEHSPGNEGLQRAFAAGPPLPREGWFNRAIRGVPHR